MLCSQHQTTELVYSASGEPSQPDSICLVTTTSQHRRALPTHQLTYHRVTKRRKDPSAATILNWQFNWVESSSKSDHSKLLSLLELNSKCSALVTTSTPNEFISVGSGAVCSVMILKKNTLRHKPITKRLKYGLLYCRVAVLVCSRFSLSRFWSSYWFVAVLVSPFLVCRCFDPRPKCLLSRCFDIILNRILGSESNYTYPKYYAYYCNSKFRTKSRKGHCCGYFTITDASFVYLMLIMA